MTPEQVLESPGTLVGSVDAIVEQLLARRELHGVSYYVIQGRQRVRLLRRRVGQIALDGTREFMQDYYAESSRR